MLLYQFLKYSIECILLGRRTPEEVTAILHHFLYYRIHFILLAPFLRLLALAIGLMAVPILLLMLSRAVVLLVATRTPQ